MRIFNRQAASVQKPREPVKDPAVTTRSFYQKSKISLGNLSLRHNPHELTSKILKRRFENDSPVQEDKKDENVIFEFDYNKEDYKGKVAEYLGKYVEPEMAMREKKRKKIKRNMTHNGDVCPWMKTYHVSFISHVPMPSSPKQKAALELAKLYPSSKS